MTRNGDTWNETAWALGLMSGTSRDGIDAALIRTDGRGRVEAGPCESLSYDPDFRDRLAAVCGGGASDSATAGVERELTLRHAVGRFRRIGCEPGFVRSAA